MEKYKVIQRESALERGCGICPVCGGSIYQYGTPQFAHKLGDTIENHKKYGSFFMKSRFVGELVCSLECNASVDVGKSQGRQLEVLVDILMYEIQRFNCEADDE